MRAGHTEDIDAEDPGYMNSMPGRTHPARVLRGRGEGNLGMFVGPVRRRPLLG